MDLFEVLAEVAPDLPEVTIEPFEGESPYGPVYGTAVQVRGFLDDTRRRVVNDVGTEVIANSTLYIPLDTTCPTRSRLTLPGGRTAVAIAVARRDGAGLPTPDHLEVSLQ